MKRILLLPLFSRLPAGLAAGVVCAALVTILLRLGWLNGGERAAMDQLFQARGSRAPYPAVTILVTDDATVARLHQWPLPRRYYADAIQRLTKAGARTIACDVMFAVPSYSAADDAFLERACRQSGRVVQAAAFHVPQIYNPVVPVTLVSDRSSLPARFAIRDKGASCRDSTWATTALPALKASSPAVGHVNVHPELDGTLRRLPHLIRYRGQVYPSLALAAAAHYLRLKPQQILADANGIQLNTLDGGHREMPLDANGEAWVNWVGGNDSFPTYNLNQLFDGQIPPEAIKDHLIVIGVTAAGAFEHRPTPFSPVQPAVELQANAMSDLLSNRPLRELPEGSELALILVFAGVAGMLSAPRRIFGATIWLLLLLAFLAYAAAWNMAMQDLYIPVFSPMVAGILTYVTVIGSNYRREWESNWRTDASVGALARGGALMASGRERELLVEVIRRTAREVLQAREVFLVLNENPAPELPALREAAQRLPDAGRVVLWNARKKIGTVAAESGDTLAPIAPDPELGVILEQLSDEVARLEGNGRAGRTAFGTVLAAPLAGSTSQVSEDDEIGAKGILVAAGRTDGLSFTSRDAVLFQTLAEQASLALDNLQYYERLRGRVELANRSLREAYQVLSDERALLAEERTKLAAAIESMESALIICDESHRSVFDNGMGGRVLSEAAPALGDCVPDTLRANGLPEFAGLFETTSEKATLETTRTIQRAPDQPAERRVLLAQLTPLLADGQRLGSMLVVTDVTAERELEKMKSDFVAFVAHELRTPLTSINGFASLLRVSHHQIGEAQRGELLETIESQCNRLNRMINDLLEVARLEPGREMDIRPREFDLTDLCDKVLTQQQMAVRDGKIELHLDYPQRPILVTLDQDRMEQILINLVSNAIKYSPDGGRVTLAIGLRAETIQLSVSDTGMGMTPDQLARLFEKYYRAPDAQARGIKGTGLGLYLVKHLVEAHGGTVEVSSAQGLGTTFTLTLPITAEPG